MSSFPSHFLLISLLLFVTPALSGCARSAPETPTNSATRLISGLSPVTVDTSAPGCSRFNGATGLQYFGFFCSNCNWVGYRQGDYMDELKDIVNIVHIGAGDHSLTFLLAQLQKAQDAGLRALVDITNYNLGSSGEQVGSFNYWWNESLPLLREYVENGTVIGFYVSDDAVPSRVLDPDYRLVRASFTKPVVLVSFIQAANLDDPQSKALLSAEADWIGVETYGWGDRAYFDRVERDFLKPNQKLVLVPSSSSDGGGSLAAMDTVLDAAANDPRVVAIMPFLWSSQKNLTGAADKPDMRARMVEVGRCFAKAPAPVNYALTTQGGVATASSVYPQGAGFVASAANDGERSGRRWPTGGGWNSAAAPSPTAPEWLEIRFNQPRTLDEIAVFTLADDFSASSGIFSSYGITDFQLQYDAGTGWVTPMGGNFAGNRDIRSSVRFAATPVQRIRVLITSALAGYARVTELEGRGTPAATVPSNLTNFAATAAGATMLASSVVTPDFAAAGAGDGELAGSRWAHGGGWNSGGNPTVDAPEWLEARLAGAQSISEVDVYTVQDDFLGPVAPSDTLTFSRYGLTDFDIQTWTGMGWETIEPGGHITGNRLVHTRVTFAPVATDRVRVLVRGALAGYARVTELEARGTAAAPAVASNVAAAAAGATAQASSTVTVPGSDFGPGSAIDGDRTGVNWEHRGGWNSGEAPSAGSPQWLQVTLSGAKTISTIRVFTLADAYASALEPLAGLGFSAFGIQDFAVQAEVNGVFTTVPQGSVRNNSHVETEISFPPVQTSRVRVVVTRALSVYARITEIEALGY